MAGWYAAVTINFPPYFSAGYLGIRHDRGIAPCGEVALFANETALLSRDPWRAGELRYPDGRVVPLLPSGPWLVCPYCGVSLALAGGPMVAPDYGAFATGPAVPPL